MLTSRRTLALVALVALATASACVGEAVAREAEAARCTMIVRITRDTTTTYILAAANPDTVNTGPGLFQYGGMRRPDRGPPSYYGQVLRARQIEGKDAESLRQTLQRRRSEEIIVVPQDYGIGCEVEPWSRSTRFVAPGTDGVFALKAWPESLWIGGRPTFYAPLARYRAYADGPSLQGPHADVRSPADSSPPPNLSAAEYLDMLMALPTNTADPAQVAKLSRWVDAHPLVRYRFPAGDALGEYPNSFLRRPQRNEAELVMWTLRIAPSDFMLQLPPAWFGRDSVKSKDCGHHLHGSFARRMSLERTVLDSVRNAEGEWDREYSAVVDSILPFSQMVAQLGPEPFGKGSACFADLQMRAYLGPLAPQALGAVAADRGLATARRIYPAATIAAHDSSGWHIDHLRWTARYYDYSGEANVELYSRVVGAQTLTLVFMHVTWPGSSGDLDRRYVLSHIFGR